MTTEHTSWQSNAINKQMTLSIEASSKRGQLLELQSRIRDLGISKLDALHQIEQAQFFCDFVDRSETAKALLKSAQDELSTIDRMRELVTDQVAQISPSVRGAIGLANAAEKILIDLKLTRA